MAQLTYRGNIQTSLFPLLSQLQGQTVIINDRDQTYVPNINPADQNNPVDRGIPQIYYAENVMPSSYGYQSIGYSLKAAGITGVSFEEIREIRRTVNAVTTYVALDVTIARTIFVLNPSNVWRQPTGAPTNLTAANKISTATVNGVSYLCVAGRGVYTVTQGNTPTLSEVVLDGLEPTNIQGLLSSVGYLITWSKTGVAWSSTSDPLDFVPSDVTGAGAGEIQDAAGDIVWCQDTSYGFIIYTTGNCVQATWSGNTSFPWNFRGIANSGGVTGGEVVSKEAGGQQYAYTTNGLQSVYHTGAKTVFPYITDFIGGRLIEFFNSVTAAIDTTTSTSPLRKSIAFISDRYLVISYGRVEDQELIQSIVLDTVQGRLGKLAIGHRTCFEIRGTSTANTEIPRESLAFLKSNGEIQVVDFALDAEDSFGTMLLGKYQATRGFMTQLIQAGVENNSPSNFELINWVSLNGKTTDIKSPGYLIDNSGQHRTYNFSDWGKNHTLLLRGSFNINTIELTFNVSGKVR